MSYTIPSVKVDTTADCNLRCNGCTADAWMTNNPTYRLTVVQLRHFLTTCKVSDYHIGRLILSGGEPLLWPALKSGVKLIKDSGVADYIEVWTNAMHYTKTNAPALKLALKHVDLVRVSETNRNYDHIQRMIADGLPVRTVNKREFIQRPKQARPESVPARCNCPHLELCGETVYACALVLWNSESDGTPIPAGMSVPVAPFFLEGLRYEKAHLMDMCQRCVGNLRINHVKVSSQ